MVDIVPGSVCRGRCIFFCSEVLVTRLASVIICLMPRCRCLYALSSCALALALCDMGWEELQCLCVARRVS